MSGTIAERIMMETRQAVEELLLTAKCRRKEIFVVGCSSSEIAGARIGSNSSQEIADAVLAGVLPILARDGIYLAAQCCEHLNRALVLEREAAESYHLEICSVVPQIKAGGAFATGAYRSFRDPVVVESVQASAGMDIGDTMIGMHLKHVAVPVRVAVKKIGEANLVCARTRPKFIGGARARYDEETGRNG